MLTPKDILSALDETSEKISDLSRTYAISLVAFFWGLILSKESNIFNKELLCVALFFAFFAIALDLLQNICRYLNARFAYSNYKNKKKNISYSNRWSEITEIIFIFKLIFLFVSVVFLFISGGSYIYSAIKTLIM